jgi:plasmid maintenance system antidote protein VapI
VLIYGMLKSNNDSHAEDQTQIDALSEFTPRIREILRGYRDNRQLSAIARQLGFHQSRLTEMITKNRKGEYKTRITPYYIARFIEGGIVNVGQILDGQELEELPIRPKMFFERMMVSRSTLKLVVEAQRRGINVESILKEMLYPNKDS